MIRITTGVHRGRVLLMPAGIRPTQQKVRKAFFDILGDIGGLSFLELFAGSGAVALEAVSRGAGSAVLVEKESACLEAIKANIVKLNALNCRVLPVPASEGLRLLFREGKRFDIVFLDPPYPAEEAKKILQTIDEYDILAPDGLLIVQHSVSERLSCGFSLIKEAKYGDTKLSFFRKASD
ncbi:MAG: 16S rRNA (guanine(966)-N(2))-methyltransferase RsmD [Candidatus Omnitrophota bacterium]